MRKRAWAGEVSAQHPPCPTHRVCLVLAAVELVAVVEDVLVGGVETGLHTVLHHLAGSWRALQLLDLACGEGVVFGAPPDTHPGAPRASATPTPREAGPKRVRSPEGQGELSPSSTFIRKKVMLVSKSTVDFKSCSRSGLLAGKLFWKGKRGAALKIHRGK